MPGVAPHGVAVSCAEPERHNHPVCVPCCCLCCCPSGFRRLGFGRLVSFLAVPFIHGSFSYPTNPGWLPDPFFRVWQKNMHRSKHGSDSGAAVRLATGIMWRPVC